jgi:hypothetical protein
MTNIAAYNFDWPAIDKAKQILGISWPVTIRRSSHKARIGLSKWEHVAGWPNIQIFITVNKNLDAERASEILWHELAHAMQYHRTAKKHNSLEDQLKALETEGKQLQLYSYDCRPSEVEARKWEKMSASLKLTTSNGSRDFIDTSAL